MAFSNFSPLHHLTTPSVEVSRTLSAGICPLNGVTKGLLSLPEILNGLTVFTWFIWCTWFPLYIHVRYAQHAIWHFPHLTGWSGED